MYTVNPLKNTHPTQASENETTQAFSGMSQVHRGQCYVALGVLHLPLIGSG
jgi:hypothetical protein